MHKIAHLAIKEVFTAHNQTLKPLIAADVTECKTQRRLPYLDLEVAMKARCLTRLFLLDTILETATPLAANGARLPCSIKLVAIYSQLF